MTRIQTLDGWRGVAILMVLVGHFSPSNPIWIHAMGQHGVAIFFVLSGFLITTLLCEEKSKNGVVDLRAFYKRRFFRLAPCAWCYLISIVLLSAHLHPKPYGTLDMMGCLLFFRNYVEPLGTHPVTGHFWSLSIEEQFYLIWPPVLVWLGIRRSGWLALFGALAIAGWRLLHLTELAHKTVGYSLFTQYRADALLVGCLLALTMPRVKLFLKSWMAFPLLLSFAVCVFRSAMVPLYECVVIALLLAVTSQCGAKLLEWPPLVRLGVISYGVYIWQQLFSIIARGRLILLIVTIPLLLCVALCSFYFIEQPMIEMGKRVNKPEVTV